MKEEVLVKMPRIFPVLRSFLWIFYESKFWVVVSSPKPMGELRYKRSTGWVYGQFPSGYRKTLGVYGIEWG